MNSGKATHRAATLAKGHKTKPAKKKMRKDRLRQRAEQKTFQESTPILVKRKKSDAPAEVLKQFNEARTN